MDLVVPYAPGGGYDTFSRVLAEFLPRYLPGGPSVVVKNLPGAQGLTGVQNAMRAAPDGFTMAVIPQNLIIQELLGDDLAGFDAKTALYIGNLDAVPTRSAFFMRTELAADWESVKALGRKVTNGATAPGDTLAFPPGWVELVGGPIRQVYGYGGSTEVLAAFDRQELDGTLISQFDRTFQRFPEWLPKKFLTPVLRFGEPIPASVLEKGGWQQPPYVLDLVTATPDQREAYLLGQELLQGLRVFSLPPGVRPDVFAAHQRAFAEIGKDPAFVKAMEDRGFDVGVMTAEQISKMHQQVVSSKPEIRAMLKKLFSNN